MNKIYKIIWSKTKQRYVVVSELAHSCAKRTGRTLGKSAAALMAVLALTAGVGIASVWAAENDTWTAATDNNGNYTAYLDKPNTVENNKRAHDNYVIGDGNEVTVFDSSLILGNDNKLYTSTPAGSYTPSSGSIILGSNNTTTRNFGNGLLFGNNNSIIGGTSGTLVFGNGIELGSSKDSIILGNEAKSSGTGSVIIGHGAEGIAAGNVVIGESASSTGAGTANNVVIGQSASATGTEAVAVGYGAENHDGYGAAIGAFSKVGNGSYGLAIGGYSEVGENAQYSIAIGVSGRGYGEGSTWVGKEASHSIAMGASSIVGESALQSIAIGGYNSYIGKESSFSTALGTRTSVADGIQQATAIGYGSTITGQKGTALGTYSNAQKDSATALGENSDAGLESTATGAKAQALADYSTALGASSLVDQGAENSVAVGYKSAVVADDILDAGDVLAAAWRGSDYNQNYIAFDLNSADTNGVFSVGSVGSPRRMINVDRGRISANSTDAINGSQLFGAVQYLDGRIDAVENKIAGGVGGGDVTIDGDTNIDVTETPDSATDPGTGGDTENPGTAGDNSQNFEVSMSDNPVFGGHETDEQGHSENGSVTVIGSNGANKITLNENNEGGMVVTSGGHTVNINKGGDGLVNGLTNTTWDWAKYEDGGYEGSSNAATESQLHGAVSGIKTEITNMGDQITNMGSQITNIGNKVGELDSRIDEVGAGAAALAALHPLDFDPDDKWDFAAGYGNYRGENAVAIGAFYRSNEDTMFSVGGTVGNDDNMVNAGVSFKIGQGNGVSTSRVAMAKEIKDLRKELEAMKSAMLDVNAGRRLDTSKLQLFPDVPQNHWAYEYVATLAGNGIIEGYPDGNFDGARPMTRYEFAAMLYRAMLNGAKLSDKILTEFAPELERFTVDVVHKDSDGNPTVERVRVVKRNDTAK